MTQTFAPIDPMYFVTIQYSSHDKKHETKVGKYMKE